MTHDEVLAALGQPRPANRPQVHRATGSLGLDIALGGGWPVGKITYLYGDPDSGKTTLCLHATGLAQDAGTVLWVCGGQMFDLLRAQQVGGIDLLTLVCYAPIDVLQTLRAMREAAPGCSLIVVDTVTGIDEAGATYHEIGRELGAFARELRSTNCAAVFTSNRAISDATTGPFSGAMRALASVRARTWNGGATVTRNILMPPQAFPIRYRIDDGRIDSAGELVELGIHTGVLRRNGVWVYFGSQQLASGVGGAARYLDRHPAIADEIRDQVTACLT